MASGLLSMIAARNRSRFAGMLNRCRPTDMAPALSPKIVTLDGSPPKAAMLSCDPLQCHALVQDAIIAGQAQLRHGQEAQGAQAVVKGDHDHVARRGEVGAVIDGKGAGAEDEVAAVDENHDRQPLVLLDGGARRPDVEEQAVLGIAGRDAILRTDGTKRGGGAEIGPARVRLRCSPAQVSDRWQRIGDAAITVESAAGLGRRLDRQPADLAGRGVDCTDAVLRRGRRHGQPAADQPDRQG